MLSLTFKEYLDLADSVESLYYRFLLILISGRKMCH